MRSNQSRQTDEHQPWRTMGSWLIALAVAALLGSGRLVTLAERQPYGGARDRLLASAQIIDTVARDTGLDRPARLIDRLLGRDGAGGPGSPLRWSHVALAAGPVATATSAMQPDSGDPSGSEPDGPRADTKASVAPTSTPATSGDMSSGDVASHDTRERPIVAGRGSSDVVRSGVAPSEITQPAAIPSDRHIPTRPAATARQTPRPRRPSPADPLRVLVAGDSMAQPLGYELIDQAVDDARLDVRSDFKIASSLARPDYFDWPARVAEHLATTPPPEAVVLFIGGNENQNIRVNADTVAVVRTDAWRTAYRARVASITAQFAAADTRLYWIGLPVMEDKDRSAIVNDINAVLRSEAAEHPQVTFIDIAPLFVGPDGDYARYRPAADGQPIEVRQADGVHLARIGTRWVAKATLDALAEDWALAAPIATAAPASLPPQ